jgi:hypothetical protein
MVVLEPKSFAELSFGMLAAKPVFNQDLTFNPSTYEGPVYFGIATGAPLPRFVGGGDSTHRFKGEVTFGSQGSPPFRHDDGVTLHFEKNFRAGKTIQTDPDTIFNHTLALSTRSFNPDAVGNDICLKFVPASISRPSPEVWRYNCNTASINAIGRYALESDVLEDTSGVVERIPLNNQKQVFTCTKSDSTSPECNIHVKGILSGALTVVADNIVVEGDVVYKNQGADSTDVFGAVARNDIIVPFGVPFGGGSDTETPLPWIIDSAHPSTNRYTGITNFLAESDRDDGNTSYYRQYSETSETPRPNSVSTLDLDGFFLAAGGRFNVEGLNNIGQNAEDAGGLSPNSGAYFRGTDSKNYSLEQGRGADSFYYQDGEIWKRRAEPTFCGEHTSNDRSSCRFGKEMLRAQASAIWIYGGLMTRRYSLTSRWFNGVAGFERRTIKLDDRPNKPFPPGYPTSEIVQSLLWVKSYQGRSTLLSSISDN